MTPRATYRLQFHKDFGFDKAAELAPYLARLGVSHLYASPYLKAHPGSTHGYDIVDHDQLNPELGGEAAFGRLTAALSASGLRQILDFVPNHMGVGGADNALWLDLLEWGPEADHAGWFDVDWTPDRSDLRNKVLVPFLGDQYGAALKAGHMVLKFDPVTGSFAVWAHDTHKLPICPTDYAEILGHATRSLKILGDAFSDVLRWRPQIMRRTRDLKAELAHLAMNSAEASDAIAAAVRGFNGRAEQAASWTRLDALIAKQNWKASHFLVAADDINYRRFFNIATLAGLRMELPDVFDHAHRFVFKLMEDDLLDGLRIDHIDGLFDPKAYLDRLRSAGPRSREGGLPYLVVEKILGADEPLRDDWPVDGTTGYEFTNLLTGLFIRTGNEYAFAQCYASFVGPMPSYDAIVLASKLQIIDNEMSSELQRLARSATRVAREDASTTDFTHTVLQRAIRQIVAAFPVYRTYIDGENAPTSEDMTQLDTAIERAARNDTAIDASVFAFLRQLLSGVLLDTSPRYRTADVFRCAMKLQQYCGPVMAKGVEDTAFYRYNRFVAANEVGGDPDQFGVPVSRFHEANAKRAARWPTSMLATSTHDTKRGEDTRARLAALSNHPEEWTRLVGHWSAIMRADAPGLDPNDEYLLYQLLVGTWPAEFIGEGNLDPAGVADYTTRLKAALQKSLREAKVHSTWVRPDEAYEAAAFAMIEQAVTGAGGTFLASFRPFVNRIAEDGAAVSFAQTVLKFTVPGMPDIYQGCELWDFSMVDPDNRRPVDFETRAAMLDEVDVALKADRREAMRGLWKEWRDGRFKLALTRLLLAARAADPALFAEGAYEALTLDDDATCAFARHLGATTLVVVARLAKEGAASTLILPAHLANLPGHNLLTGRTVRGDRLDLAEMLDGLPATAVLYRG